MQNFLLSALFLPILITYSSRDTNQQSEGRTISNQITHSVQATIRINATPSKVWDVLTNPDKIVLYTGSATQTDWVEGSPITWSGELQGMKYRNKGRVLENVPNELLRFTFWSGMGGDADLPENYSEITYAIDLVDDETVELTYSRIKIPTEIEKQIFEGHLQSMLEEIKRHSEE